MSAPATVAEEDAINCMAWQDLPVLSPCPTCAFPSAVADVDLTPAVGHHRYVEAVFPDLAGDGSDDVVIGRMNYRYFGVEEDKREVSYDLLGSPALDLTAITLRSTTLIKQDQRVFRGISELWPTVDATGDGLPDLWLEDADLELYLLPGPFVGSVSGVATASAKVERYEGDYQAIDVDGDGLGDLAAIEDYTLTRCPGPFSGAFDATACSSATFADSFGVTLLHLADLEGDGVPDLLASRVRDDGTTVLSVFESDFEGGQVTPVVDFVAPWETTFLAGSTAFADFDGDGYSDVAWADLPRNAENPTSPVVAVSRGPAAVGASIGSGEAELQLLGSASCSQEILPADVHGDGAAALLITSSQYDGILVADAAGSGVVDPLDASPVLASDRVVAAMVGDFDGDGRADVVAGGDDHDGWIFLGASLP